MSILDNLLGKKENHEQSSIKGFVLFYLLIAATFLIISPWVISSKLTSTAYSYSYINIVGSCIALAAGIACLICFLAKSNRFFVIVAFGFFFAGSADLIQGALFFNRFLLSSSIDFSTFVSRTYVIGKLVLAISLIVAAFWEYKTEQAKKTMREAWTFSMSAIVVGVGTIILLFIFPIPQVLFPNKFISRPVDFIAAILFLVAFVLLLKRFLVKKDYFSGMLLASTLVVFGGQFYMAFSKRLYDGCFDVAHYAIIFSYVMPVLGVAMQGLEEMRRACVEANERKKTEKALSKSEERFKQVVENAQEWIWETNAKGLYTYSSPVVEKMLGYKKDEIVGKKYFYDFYHDEDREELKDWSFKVYARKEPFRGLIKRKIRKDNSTIWLSTSGVPVIDDEGELLGYRGVYSDVTERKMVERLAQDAREELETHAWELKRANDANKILYKQVIEKNKELAKLDQMKSDFVSTVSHELRTPLTITKEGINVVLDELPGKVNEKQKKFLTTSINSIDRLMGIINDLLDISKLEFGKEELQRAPVDLGIIVTDLVMSFSVKAKRVGLKLKPILPEKEMDIYVDGDKIYQVFTNLINNAIKFTKKGHIEIGVVDKEKEVVCSVTDTGKGISKYDLPKVFSKFHQFGRIEGGGEKGTGLGLAICKQIVEMHKGNIWVESELDKGTKFIFTLPKFTTEAFFKEYINSGIEKALKSNSKMSLIMVSIAEFHKFKKKYPATKIRKFLQDIASALEDSLRRTGDVVVKDTGELIVLLPECAKEGVGAVGQRLEQELKDYLAENGWGDINLKFGSATYPDEAMNDKELIEKVKIKM